MYQSDFDNFSPPPNTWVTGLDPYTKYRAIYKCPEVKADFAFALNDALNGLDTSKEPQPQNVVAIFESTKTHISAHDNLASIPRPGRHAGRSTFGYLDGHAKQRPTLKPE